MWMWDAIWCRFWGIQYLKGTCSLQYYSHLQCFTTSHIPISLQSYSTTKRPLSPCFGLAPSCSDGPTSSLGVQISITHDCRHMWHFSDHFCMFLDIPFFFHLFPTLYSLFLLLLLALDHAFGLDQVILV